jgi:hypothetical protein
VLTFKSQVQLQIFTRGFEILDVETVQKQLKCGFNEFTTFIMNMAPLAKVTCKQALNKFACNVIHDFVVNLYELIRFEQSQYM